MRYLVGGAGIVVILVLLVVIVGLAIPVKHRATRSAAVHAPAARVAALITDVAAYPAWRTGLKEVQIIDDSGTRRRYREHSADGTIEYLMDLARSPHQITTTIVGGVTAFGGTWNYDLATRGDTTDVRITEDGEVYNPIFRFVSRFIVGQTATLDRYLADLKRRAATPP